jgi:cell division protein DivIC
MPEENKKRATTRLNTIREKRIKSKRMILSISFVVVAFCIVMGIQLIQQCRILGELKEQESSLEKKYQKELQLSEELKEQESYVKTDDYIEEMARKLGLLYPNEVIIKPEE